VLIMPFYASVVLAKPLATLDVLPRRMRVVAAATELA
jgi:hypothetical protein